MAWTQVFEDFWSSPNVGRLIGSTSQLLVFLLRDSKDLHLLAEHTGMADSAKERVGRFEMPGATNPPHSTFLYQFAGHGGEPVAGVCRGFATPEVVYTAASSGEGYSERINRHREKGHPDLITAVILESGMNSP